MAKICYVEKRFSSTSQYIIQRANQIIDSYAAQGYKLTLRQLFYQFVSRDWFPASWADARGITNREESYSKLGAIINDARLAGLVDWDAIADRTREVRNAPFWNSPADILRVAARQYTPDMWATQEYRPFVLVEKDALLDVVAQTCRREDVNFGSCRGYMSQSTMHDLAMRMVDCENTGQTPVILHLGDHDPSGLDMSRDIRDRLSLFVGHNLDMIDVGYEIELQRLALNIDQVRQYNPPPNPAKMTDSRFDGYEAEFGRSSWELDALPPNVIDAIITGAINTYRDQDAWDVLAGERDADRQQLISFTRNWDK